MDEIKNAITRLKPKTSMGMDAIPSYIVKGCSEHFLLPLYILFNQIIRTSLFSDRWKTTKICPIRKSGKVKEVSNFRPIAILNVFSKIFESIIYHRIINQVRPAISEYQHGFLKGRSTVTNLAVLTDFVAHALD